MNSRRVFLEVSETRRAIHNSRILGFSVSAIWFVAVVSFFVIAITASVQAGLLTLYMHGFHNVAHTWRALAQLEFYSVVWAFVQLLPLPKSFPGSGESNATWLLTLTFYAAFMMFCAGLKAYGVKLRKNADKAEDRLADQEPILLRLAEIADASGPRVINKGKNNKPTTTITTNILPNGEKPSIFWLIIVPLCVAVAAAIITHFLHLT